VHADPDGRALWPLSGCGDSVDTTVPISLSFGFGLEAARWRSGVQGQPIGGVRPNGRKNGSISPSITVWAIRGAGNRLHRASALQEGRKK
jgi:hypothetical protein